MAIQVINLQLTGNLKSLSYVPGIPKCFRAGFLQFSYGTKRGKLQPINWQQSMFLPEYNGATGALIWVPPDISWSAQTVDEHPNGISMSTTAGVINLAKGILTGVTRGNFPSILPSDFGLNKHITLPRVSGARNLVSTNTADNDEMSRPATNTFSYQFWASALAFASEIAQQACYANAAETTETFPSVTRSSLITPTSGVPRYADVEVISIPGSPDMYWGSRGIPILGKFAWDYGGYKLPAQDINGQSNFFAPPVPGATSAYVILKPGIAANITLGENTFAMMSLQNALGQINFLAGEVGGLLP